MKIVKQKWAGSFELEDEQGEIKEIKVKFIDLEDMEKIQEIESKGADRIENIREILAVYCPEATAEDFQGVPAGSLNELLVFLTETGTGKKLSAEAKKKLSGNA